ncbi:MAG: metal/formaldehyde-sensitive transcriptional repressor [Chthonomonadales bacterium]|nr:metal/formaldehyde-sensitive transcriptional repressor [Chthonomonadales bacterium]
MSHTIKDKKKLIDRVRRILGQMEGIEKALEQEKDPAQILQSIAACRGAMNGLMAEVMEGHIRLHVVDPERPPTPEQTEAVEEIIDVIKAYLK